MNHLLQLKFLVKSYLISKYKMFRPYETIVRYHNDKIL